MAPNAEESFPRGHSSPTCHCNIFKFGRYCSRQCHILEINSSRKGRILTITYDKSHIDTKYERIVSNLGRDTPANSNVSPSDSTRYCRCSPISRRPVNLGSPSNSARDRTGPDRGRQRQLRTLKSTKNHTRSRGGMGGGMRTVLISRQRSCGCTERKRRTCLAMREIATATPYRACVFGRNFNFAFPPDVTSTGRVKSGLSLGD